MVIYCSIFYLYIIQKTVDINVFTAYYRGSFWIKKLSNTLREPKTKKNSKNSTSKTTTTRRWLFYFIKVTFSNEKTQHSWRKLGVFVGGAAGYVHLCSAHGQKPCRYGQALITQTATGCLPPHGHYSELVTRRKNPTFLTEVGRFRWWSCRVLPPGPNGNRIFVYRHSPS